MLPGTTRTMGYLLSLGLLLGLLAMVACSDSGDHNGGQTPPAMNPAPEELTALANEISEANGGRAAILHVTTAGGKHWDVSAGLADVSSEARAEIGDQAEIGSISKVFLAVTVLRLVEQGILSLDDPLTQWFGESQLDQLTDGNGSSLVLRHLLNHSTGIGDYLNFAPDETVLQHYGVSGETAYMPEELVEFTVELTRNPVAEEFRFPSFTPQDADGQSYPDYDAIPYMTYSNTGYVMLGMIVQAVTGERYEDMITQEVIEPLGLKDTGFGTDGAQADLTGYALGLAVSGDDPVAMSPTLSWSAGQVISTPGDLALFMSAAIEGELFDEPETLELWTTQYYKFFHEPAASYGLGLMLQEIEGTGSVYGHDGQVFGASALMAYNADTGDLFTVAVNNSQYRPIGEPGSPGIWELVARMQAITENNR